MTPMEKESQTINILYIGSDEAVIDRFRSSGFYNITVMSNPLAAIYWLTDNQFKIFDLDKDTRFDITYE